jgi:hypothetical protein
MVRVIAAGLPGELRHGLAQDRPQLPDRRRGELPSVVRASSAAAARA